ncbi:hypothetical protein ACPRNU_22580 [Chromobacterium vaccinii]|uniref:hypothetical protein n=1 Tax=Chromobacterium vaccinii TaxID=1108595 RepID=UPI003C70A9F7
MFQHELSSQIDYLEPCREAPLAGMARIPQSVAEVLENVEYRWSIFAGLSDPATPEETTQRDTDRQTYPQWLHWSATGKPAVKPEYKARCMAAMSGLPFAYCLTWDYFDFIDTVDCGLLDGDPDALIQNDYDHAIGLMQQEEQHDGVVYFK